MRTIVKEEIGHLEKVLDARFEAVGAKIDSLEKRFPTVQELAENQSKAKPGRTQGLVVSSPRLTRVDAFNWVGMDSNPRVPQGSSAERS